LSRAVPAERDADGTPVVVKRGPGVREEARALAAFRGAGVVALLEQDGDALVLERVLPGTPLVSVADDDAATRIAAGVMRRLWRPPPVGFPTVADWGEGFARHRAAHGGGSGPLDPALFSRAERLFAALCASQAAPVLLHGDLHHFNVLEGRGGAWVAIDPKGVVGEPCYEPGALLRNPYPELPSRARMARRLDVLAGALGFERERLRDWAFAQAVLSAVWHVEDGDPGEGRRYAMACAERLQSA
jgi:streptomycin 6-kinase